MPHLPRSKAIIEKDYERIKINILSRRVRYYWVHHSKRIGELNQISIGTMNLLQIEWVQRKDTAQIQQVQRKDTVIPQMVIRNTQVKTQGWANARTKRIEALCQGKSKQSNKDTPFNKTWNKGDNNAPSTDEGHVYKDQLIRQSSKKSYKQEVIFAHNEWSARTNCVSNDEVKS